MPIHERSTYIGRLLRRAAVESRRILSLEVRQGQAWTRRGWQLGRTELEQRSLRRLASLVRGFRRIGLCEHPDFDAISGFRGLGDLAQLPILTRPEAMQLYVRLRPLYASRRDVYSRGTGGWTGEPVHYFRSCRLDRICYGMRIEMQSLMGWRPGMPCYSLWANPRELGIHRKRRSGIGEAMRMVKLYGRYSPTEDELLEFLEALRGDPGCAVYGSPGLLLECVHYMRERGIRFAPGHIAAAWSTAETIDPRLPESFPRYFNAPLRDFYGSRETSSISAECQCGNLHINSRYCIEICDEHSGELLPNGASGSILITDLFNDITPLIRYQIGDYGAIKWLECECGRRGFVFARLIGRPPQVIELASGSRLTPYSFLSLAQQFPTIHRVQLIRHGPHEFDYRYVGTELHTAEQRLLADLASQLAEGASVRVVHVDDVEKSPSGKPYYYLDRCSHH